MQAEALAMPVNVGSFHQPSNCHFVRVSALLAVGRDVQELNCRVEWTSHCLVFGYSAPFRKHRKLAVFPKRREMVVLCNASDAFTLFSLDVQFVITVQKNANLTHNPRFFLSQ